MKLVWGLSPILPATGAVVYLPSSDDLHALDRCQRKVCWAEWGYQAQGSSADAKIFPLTALALFTQELTNVC